MMPLLLAAAVAVDNAAAFRTSDVYQRLVALRQEITQVVDMGGDEVLVVDYVPKQGALSEWDDESRLVLYKRKGNTFEREQFVSRAGKSIPGRLDAVALLDLDGDGLAEILVIGQPHAPSGRVSSQIYRRPKLGERFEQIWKRRDHLAAFKLGKPLGYVTLDPTTFTPHWQLFALQNGQLNEVKR